MPTDYNTNIGAVPLIPGSSITECNPEYLQYVEDWERSDAVLGGARAVKDKAEKFIPLTEWDRRHIDLWQAYVQRGSYVNFTSRTYAALIGLLFRKDHRFQRDRQRSARSAYRHFYRACL